MSTVTYLRTRTFWIAIVAIALAAGVLFAVTGSGDSSGRKGAIGAVKPAPTRSLCEQYKAARTPRVQDALRNNHREYDFKLCGKATPTPTPTPTKAPSTKAAPTSAQCATYANSTEKQKQVLARSYGSIDWTKCLKTPPATSPVY